MHLSSVRSIKSSQTTAMGRFLQNYHRSMNPHPYAASRDMLTTQGYVSTNWPADFHARAGHHATNLSGLTHGHGTRNRNSLEQANQVYRNFNRGVSHLLLPTNQNQLINSRVTHTNSPGRQSAVCWGGHDASSLRIVISLVGTESGNGFLSTL
jgi:hypothetical protein